MNPDYLLTLPLAQQLYHDCAEHLPIIDYHNHLPAAQLGADYHYANITQLWISSDPYKHRAMRILGVPERLITGDSTDYEKFRAWYTNLPRLIGNPLFDWSRMELSMVFGMELLPFGDCEAVWNRLNEALAGMSAKDILDKFHIVYSAPCTALTDDLSVFAQDPGLAPSLRGDDLLLPEKALLQKLEGLTGCAISSLDAYIAAVNSRLEAFQLAGCRFTDHALDNGFCYLPDDGGNEARFASLLRGEAMSDRDALCLRSEILTRLAGCYSGHGFTMQLHIGAQRTTSTRLRKLAGAAGGYAAIGSTADVRSLTAFLDAVEQRSQGLPRVLLFPLNPADNAVMATLSGSYSADDVEGLVSQGPAWWWCDHAQGIRQMLETFSAHSVLSAFTGMTTDSRSILSFVRHDYFRRCLCQWMAEQVQQERLPDDFVLLADTVRRICFENANKRIGG